MRKRLATLLRRTADALDPDGAPASSLETRDALAALWRGVGALDPQRQEKPPPTVPAFLARQRSRR